MSPNSKMTQEQYLAILFDDCCYTTAAQRRGWISKRFPGKNYPDELNTQQKSQAINELKQEKEFGL